MLQESFFGEKARNFIRKVIQINIQAQREFLSARLLTEPLTSNEENQNLIQTFQADKKGKGLELFLKNYAWEEDLRGTTKVYLVKDVQSGDIVFYFALCSGLLYKEIGTYDYNLSDSEQAIVDTCIQAFQDGDDSINIDVVLSWYDDNDPSVNKEKVRKLVNDKIEVKSAAQDDREKTGTTVNIRQVSETFPGIIVTHFCKNKNCKSFDSLSFPIGFYVFWEIVIKKILHISSLLGCQYLYLFAADNTEQPLPQSSVLYSEDWDDDEAETDTTPVYKLVEYYKNELKFEDVQDVTVLKPYYDFQCFSLIQKISTLQEHRDAAWIQHSDVDK